MSQPLALGVVFTFHAGRDPNRPMVTFEGRTMTRGEIADYLGLTLETVSRHMTRLKASRIIEMGSNRLVLIRDMARLELKAGIDRKTVDRR